MKKCFKCGTEKSLGDFYKHKGMADGHLNKCKDCNKADVKKNSVKVGSKYDHSEIGVIRVIYKTQKRHNKIRGHGDIPFSKKELTDWLYANGFKQLYNEWLASGNDNDLKPSVDRINDFIGYEFSNIRLGTWRMNRNHQADDIVSGNGTSGRRCKVVIKMDVDKNIICKYVSYSSAARDCGYSVEYQIKKGIKCKNGFYWSYESL